MVGLEGVYVMVDVLNDVEDLDLLNNLVRDGVKWFVKLFKFGVLNLK